MVKYKTIKQFAAESGYTESAIRAKCSKGIWPEGQVWIRAPDNKPLINVEGYHAWVESGPAPRAALRAVTNVPPIGKGKSPPPLI
ncbi:excisionase [Stutzerimonas stutzeri]|nr:excisionase [Stutzerimonas stutzeri]